MKSTQKVFYVPGQLNCIDYVLERSDGVLVTQFMGQTLEEVQLRFPGAVVLSEEACIEQCEAACRTEPKAITAEQYEDALCVLPPCDYRGAGTAAESFKFLEHYSGRITTIYARVDNRFYRFNDICTLPHAEIVAKIRTIESASVAP